MPLPTQSLRTNRGTWAVPTDILPTVALAQAHLLLPEPFDPAYAGQRLATTYLDTANFTLRKARLTRTRYLTLRVRCYQSAADATEAYAFSAKTEDQKFRIAIPAATAHAITQTPAAYEAVATLLPAPLLARLLQLIGETPLQSVVRVHCRRYACEDDQARLTLDVNVRTDLGKRLPFNVLEFKSTNDAPPPLAALHLRPVKLSKFLWATGV